MDPLCRHSSFTNGKIFSLSVLHFVQELKAVKTHTKTSDKSQECWVDQVITDLTTHVRSFSCVSLNRMQHGIFLRFSIASLIIQPVPVIGVLFIAGVVCGEHPCPVVQPWNGFFWETDTAIRVISLTGSAQWEESEWWEGCYEGNLRSPLIISAVLEPFILTQRLWVVDEGEEEEKINKHSSPPTSCNYGVKCVSVAVR